MSRLRRLKKLRRKNRIKATACGLALALAIGSAQGLGTYALFTDVEDVPSDLAISTGDVDVEINPGKSFENMKPNKEITIPVKITNYGTLNQNIKLDLFISEAIKPYLTEAEYKFNGVSIKYSENEVENGIMYKDNSLFILAPGACIEGTIKMNIKEMPTDVQNQLSNYTKHNINVKVKATQISDDNQVFNNGFYDEVIQENTITIAPREIITVAIGEYAHYINENGNKYKAVFIPVNVNGIIEANNNDIHIAATVNGNNVSYNAEYVDKGTNKYIKITPKEGSNIEFQDDLNITINIKVGKDDEYSQQCWIEQVNASNSNCQEANHPHGEPNFRCQIQVVNSEPQNKNWNTLEETSTIDEIELPVEQLKEESQESRELETIEPPMEQELIIPNEEELIESPK